jgi:hypothetical protein
MIELIPSYLETHTQLEDMQSLAQKSVLTEHTLAALEQFGHR